MKTFRKYLSIPFITLGISLLAIGGVIRYGPDKTADLFSKMEKGLTE